MAKFPAMPFWFDAYWRDTQHLTYEEHGLYLAVLSLLWHAPGQRIPNDRQWIRRRFKSHTPKAMGLINEFCQNDGNWIRQKRLTREYKWVSEKAKKQSDRSKARWDKEKDLSHGISRGNAAAMPPTPTPTREERKKEIHSENGNGKHRVKPRHGSKTKDGKRVWLDRGTADWNSYAAAYAARHAGMAPPTQWNGSGTWFNLQTGDA